MLIFPAIDLYEGKAVRLYKGDYEQKTVYSDCPPDLAVKFRESGARQMHIVDLEGAKNGTTPNFDLIREIKRVGGLFCEVGGGVRSLETAEKYISSGIDRVILGTSAVTDEEFLKTAVREYGEKIAVGIDIKDGFVAIRGWCEKSGYTADEFVSVAESVGVKTLIVTDISKDGAMSGTNHGLYGHLKETTKINIIASGGVSSLEDVIRLKEIELYGAIIGKAYYTGGIDLGEAVEAAK